MHFRDIFSLWENKIESVKLMSIFFLALFLARNVILLYTLLGGGDNTNSMQIKHLLLLVWMYSMRRSFYFVLLPALLFI